MNALYWIFLYLPMILTLKFPHDQINKSFYLPKAQFHRFHDKMSLDSNTNKVIQFTESKSDESTYESDEKISHSISPHQKLSKDAWIDYKTRFDNVARLYDGAISLERLFNSHVCVIGLGGVGSWVCEGLIRSGVGRLTLIDSDDVCISNVNRQIQATTSTVGVFKADALRTRMLDINPHAHIDIIYDFVTPENIYSLLGSSPNDSPSEHKMRNKFDCIIDAADKVADKAAIVDFCVRTGTMIVVSGGAGGLVDPTLLRVTDLSRTLGDNLSMRVRKKLRQDYFYPLGDATSVKTKKPKTVKLWNVPCVHTLPTGARRQAVVKAEVTASTGTDVSGDSNSCVSDTISSEYQYINPTNSVTMEKDLLDSAPVSDVVTVSNPTTTTGGGFRACDLSFGNACFATGTLGLIIASVAVSAVATNVYQIPRRKLLIRTNAPKSVIESVNLTILCSNTTAKMDNYDNISNTNEEDCTCGQPYANTSFNSSSLCVPVTQFPTESDKQPTQISTSDQSKVSTDQGIPPPVTSASNANSILENSTSIVAGAVLTSEAFNQLFPVSTSPIIDAHCHLQLGPLWEDSVSAVTLAQRVGIKHLIVCGTAPGDDWLRVQELSRRFPGSVRANYGVHPWRIASLITSGSDKGADTTIVSSTSSSSILSTTSILTQSWLPSVMESLESLLLADPLAGVGECGLDKSIKKKASLELQNEILHAHFQLARKHHRSITLHCVGAWGRLYDVVLENSRASESIVASMVDNSIGTHILVDNNVVSVSTNNYNYSNSNDRVKSVILHCCNSMPIEFVSLFAALPDVYFSLTMKTFCEKEAALCRAIPLTRLLLETDSPDQLPIEFRRLRVSSVPSTLETSAPPYTTTTSGINTDATDINDNNMSTSQPIFDYNQPALLHYGAQKVARILNLELDQIASITYENTLRAFF